MSITIEEALQLPIMKETRLVAGERGIHRHIKWVTIVEVIEDISRLSEGEFLITTGYGLDRDDQLRKTFIDRLVKQKLSGVAIHTGFYLKEIPEEFIQSANRHGFPIIEIPMKFNFSMITKVLLQQIVNRQIQMLEYSEDIHQRFTQLVLSNLGLASIADILHELTGGAVRIYNDIGEELYQSHQNTGPADREEIRSIYHKLSQAGKVEEMFALKELVEHEILIGDEPHKVVLQPVVANDYTYGFITVVKPLSRWEDLDYLAISHASTVCAIEFLKQAAISETEMRMRGDFLEELLSGHTTSPINLIERGKKLGYDLTGSHGVLCFRLHFSREQQLDTETQQYRDKLYHTVEYIVQQQNHHAILRQRHDLLILMVRSDGDEEAFYRIAREVLNHWRYYHPTLPLSIGIGYAASSVESIPRSAREAEYALQFGRLLAGPEPIYHYQDLEPYHILIDMLENGVDLKAFYEKTLGGLLDTRRNRSGNPLLETLEMYLQQNMNMQSTSASLHIHRHTLKYRLQQIEKKTGKSLSSPHQRMQMQLAVMAYRMLKEMENNPFQPLSSH
ncbi:MAG: PucR family transcriptional regulator ligand-binding domain-containing protein [Bacillaceae bacterium]|nr:PucR family transcriptional regulator ligand-binding domain-containing protein [Bacillaceae bacterium]